jgi:hemoglobin-like flavoprotein
MGITKHPLYSGAGDPSDVPIDRALIGRLQASFARAAAHGDALADRFYARLFGGHPELRSMFPADMTEQKEKLFATLAEVVAHLYDPVVSVRALDELGRAHATYGARPEHYPIVCDALARALAEVSGAAWSDELERDWRGALELLSTIMIDAAKQQAT